MPFSRGFQEARAKADKSSAFIMSCLSCEHYFQAAGDEKEVCQNNAVTKYDMVIGNGRVYCIYWKRAVDTPKDKKETDASSRLKVRLRSHGFYKK